MAKNEAHIVFIHKGDPGYLRWSLLQARRSNPEAAIDLIGDESNDHYDFVTHHDLGSYMKSADGFARHYVHYSTNPYWLELLWLQRYFVLKDFMSSNRIQHCYYCDSDVMIFFDYAAERERNEGHELCVVTDTQATASSAHTSFWNGFEAIEHFCQFIMDIYTDKDRQTMDNLLRHYDSLQKRGKGGGAGDMTVLFFYKGRNPDRVGEMSAVKDMATHDVNINAYRNGGLAFTKRFGIKKIDWIGGLPYGTVKKTGEKICFKMLHCQGSAKRYMERIYLGKPPVPFVEGAGIACMRMLRGKINAVRMLAQAR